MQLIQRIGYLGTPLAAAVLAACSSGGGDSTPGTGTLNIGLTDSPVESAESVVVAFTGIELKAKGSAPMDPVVFDAASCDDFDAATGTCSIDLLDLTGTTRQVVFNDQIPAGDYEWIRLLVDADMNEMDSYIELDDGTMCSMWVPSGNETGLKIVSGITVTTNGVSDYTLDFDVRKSVTAPPGLATGSTDACTQNYILKPAIRIVDTTEVGSIEGTVDAALLDAAECRDDDIDGIVDNVAVYVFEDFDAGNPVSVDDFDGDGDAIASASVVGDGTSYSYEVGYLLPGEYRLGLTCTADVDDVTEDEFSCDAADPACTTTDPAFSFLDESSVSVEADAVSNGDFQIPL